jgi:hypothetical protein
MGSTSDRAPSEYSDLPIEVTWGGSGATYGQIGYNTVYNSLSCSNYINSYSDEQYKTSEVMIFEYSPGSPYQCIGDAPEVNVTAFWDYSSTQIKVCADVIAYQGTAPSSYKIFLGNSGDDQIVSNPTTGTTYCSIVNDFSTINGQSIGNGWFGSFRYTYRHGTQFAGDLYEVGASSANGYGKSSNEFDALLSAYSLTDDHDIYAPMFYLTPTPAAASDHGVSTSFDYTSGSSGAYYDCYMSSQFNNYQFVAYQSKVCNSVSTYISYSYGDSLVPTLDALQQLVNSGDPDAYVSSSMCGSYGSCHTANEVANYIYNNFAVTSGSTFIGIYACFNFPLAKLSCNTSIASAVRTTAYAELVTYLGYAKGESNYTAKADAAVQSIINSIQGSASFSDTNGHIWYRPLSEGSLFIAWDGNNYNAGTSWASSFLDMFGMPNEYSGLLASNQESSFAGLAALCSYNYYANSVSNSCT